MKDKLFVNSQFSTEMDTKVNSFSVVTVFSAHMPWGCETISIYPL